MSVAWQQVENPEGNEQRGGSLLSLLSEAVCKLQKRMEKINRDSETCGIAQVHQDSWNGKSRRKGERERGENIFLRLRYIQCLFGKLL